MNSVLLLADDDEPNLQRLKTTCQWLGVPCFVLNPSVLQTAPMAWSPWDHGFVLQDTHGARMVSSDISGVWTRRYRWPYDNNAHPGKRLTSIEVSYTWQAMTSSLTEQIWMNRPALMPQWDNRLTQVRLACSLGWKVPESIVTNDPAVAREFLRTHGNIIVKHISSGGPEQRADRLLTTQALSMDQESLLDHVRWCPTLLQTRIDKTYELRAIVIGDHVFVGGIQPSKDARSAVDGRLWVMTDMKFARVEIEPGLQRRLIELTKAMGFTYGAVDLIIDPNDDVYFLELNCSGQWGFIEGATGLPISETIIQVLSEANRRSSARTLSACQ